MQKLINSLMPFLLAGIAIVAFAFGVMLLAYLFLFGALIGISLFVINWLRNKFYPPKTIKPHDSTKTGRIIDSKDWKEL